MSYLQALTIRLAQGVAQLPEPLRTANAKFLLAKQNADGGFSGREGPSDLYYTSFALRSVALLGELQGPTAERAATFLQSQFNRQAAIIDFLSLIYGAMLLDTSAGINIFTAAQPSWPDAVCATLERLRRPDGGYAKTDEGQSSSTYQSFLVVLCQQLLERPLVEPERLAAFAKSRQRDDGGFVEIGPMRNSGTNPTAAAIGLLKILDACDSDVRENTLDFLANMQSDEGGMRANTRIPLADVLSTFTGILTLSDLKALAEIDLPAARKYVESLAQPDGGFWAGHWDNVADVEYTFYGLGALALLETHV
jgi:geranylgeranyl transferase type-2 subunit beta